MPETKTILFVTYGGGHARMVMPVIRALEEYEHIRCETIALTTAAPLFKNEGLPYKGYKDFLKPEDNEALAWGEKLIAGNHNPESGIEAEESIAYLGLSYMDMVMRHGAAEAAQLWATRARQAFLPLSVMERIIGTIKPDMVVTTNSPRSEQAAIRVARRLHIPTLSMADLFGIYHLYPLEADTITVLCESVIDNMRAEGVTKPREDFLIAGNPAFDHVFDYRGPIDYGWRREHFSAIPEGSKVLLWVDVPGYTIPNTQDIHIRTRDEILGDLDALAEATKANGACLLIRPHPSQQRGLYDEWLKKTAHAHVFFAGGLPLYPLLKAVDAVATHVSTVSVEALLMQRPVLQLKYQPGRSDVPLDELQLAWIAQSPQELPQRLHEVLHDTQEWERMKQRTEKLLPQTKAAAIIARHIADFHR